MNIINKKRQNKDKTHKKTPDVQLKKDNKHLRKINKTYT